MIKRDSISVGMAVGALIPLGFLAGLYLLVLVVVSLSGLMPFVTLNSLVLLSIAPNFLFVRHYINRKKMENTGKGFLFITVGYILLFFLFVHDAMLFQLPGLQP